MAQYTAAAWRRGAARSVKLPALLVALTAVVLAAGCWGGEPKVSPTSDFTPADARDAMRQAVIRVLQLKSAAFTLEHKVGSTRLFPGLEMSKAYGVADIPDRVSLTVEAESAFPRSYLEISVITLEDTAYMTDILSGKWREVGIDSLPFTFSDLGRTLADIIEAVEDPEIVGAELVLGHDSHRIAGMIRSEDLAALVPGAGTGFDVRLVLWLSRLDSLLVQVLITGKVMPSDLETSVRLLTLDDIDVPVNITAPK